MVVIRHEPPDLRRHIRSQAPIAARINEIIYTVTDWSLDGFRIDSCAIEDYEVGERLFAQVTLQFQGLEVSLTPEVEVVRLSSEDGTLVVRFVNLTAREKEIFGLTMLGETRNGKHHALIEALARTDIPLTPTPALPSAKEAPPLNRLSLACRRIFFTLFYWTIGIALGLVIALTLYAHFFRLDLEYSVVSLPLYPVISQDVARCQEIYVKEGDTIRVGQPLFRVEDDVLTRDLELAEIQVVVSKVDVQTAEGRVQKEKEKLALYQGITQDRLQKTQAQVEGLTRQVKAAKAQSERIQFLRAQKSASQEEVDRLELVVAGLEANLAVEKAEVRIAEHAVETLKHGDFYDGRRLVGELQQYQVNFDDAQERHKVATERLKQARDRAKRLTYYAPLDGKVVKLLKVVGGTMNRGEALAILEKAGEEPVIDCFVTQDDASNLTLEANASIWIPALQKTCQGQIVKIDRTSGFLTEMQAHMKDSQLRYNWRGQQDHSAYVQVSISEELSLQERQSLTGGMPVIVSVPRTPTLWNRIQSLFR